ncbi:MAG: helix-hairpin-helix domain-containing protein [Candidatus Aenigmarchaeota archaeon]|nr:helix-hairpin-helix domain-containing protein [Candidatus Aenigmarchaeota archaeon]
MQAQRILRPEGKVVVAVDYREKETASFLEMFGAVVNMDALVVGDFVCSDRVVVERKAHSDFVGSIIDGRLFEQAHHMRDHFEKPVFIIEGHSDRDISVNALKAAIATLATQYNASVLNTKNPKDTALTIFWLAKKEQQGAGRELSIMVGKKSKDEKRLQEEIVCGLPGVGPEISKRLLKQFGSVAAVFGAGEDDLKKVKGIGKKLAARIHKISEKRY